MTREKVIEGLETALAVSNVVVGTDYVVVKIGEVKKVLELLKDQEYARCGNCQFRDFGENEVDSWDRCKLHRHNTSPDEYCSWFVERAGEVGCG